MARKSMTTQRFYVQREVAPGTPVTDAMKRVHGIRVTPGVATEGESFKASGAKVTTSRVTHSITGAPSVEVALDYNAWTWALTGAYGAPVTDAADVGGTPSTVAFEHRYSLSGDSADPRVSFTGMWGDADGAVAMPFFLFNGFGATLGRTSGSVTASAISGEPDMDATAPTTGVVEVGSAPIQGRSWRVYIDDSWATLGTTKMLALYEASPSMDGKYVMDYVLDADVPSFADVLESDSTTYTLGLNVGFDAAARDLYADFKKGDYKYVRLESTGADIETGVPYSATLDFCVLITEAGQFTTAPNSPAVVLPFTSELAVDPVTGNVSEAVLVNTVPSL